VAGGGPLGGRCTEEEARYTPLPALHAGRFSTAKGHTGRIPARPRWAGPAVARSLSPTHHLHRPDTRGITARIPADPPQCLPLYSAFRSPSPGYQRTYVAMDRCIRSHRRTYVAMYALYRGPGGDGAVHVHAQHGPIDRSGDRPGDRPGDGPGDRSGDGPGDRCASRAGKQVLKTGRTGG
jgi:hypothetical protein